LKRRPAIPTLPQSHLCSTIGVLGLNFRVRDGIGWIPRTMVTGQNVGLSRGRAKSLKGLGAVPVRFNRNST
jgi:hypothetical protein